MTARILKTLSVMGLLLPGFQVQAAPIVITAPSTVNFNFDLSGGASSPPFAAIDFFPGFGDLNAGDAFSSGLYPELNSQGAVLGGCITRSCSFNAPGMIDGIFSFSAEALNGQISVDPKAIALTADFRIVPPSGSPPPVTAVTTNQTIIFNFDLTNAVPGPPFSLVKVYPGWGDLSAGDALTVGFFTELNGQGNFPTNCLGLSGDLGSCEFSDPGFTDGVFSLAITALNGDFTVQPGAIFLGENFRLNNSPVFGTAATVNETPVPATLMLLIAGLLGATVARRRTAEALTGK